MSVTEKKMAENLTPEGAQGSDPWWIYESYLDSEVPRGPGRIASKYRGTDPENWHGPSGAAYGLPTRDANGDLLERAKIKTFVQELIEFAKQHPTTKFRLLPSQDKKSDTEFEQFTEFFRNAPRNIELMGRQLEILERLREVRIIVLDANIRPVEGDRKQVLDQYFQANAGLWDAESIEIVSLGSAQSLVSNDKYARECGYKHRIISADPDCYGEHAPQVREMLSVAHATKLVCLNDPFGTSTGNQIGAIHMAACTGLQIDELLIQ